MNKHDFDNFKESWDDFKKRLYLGVYNKQVIIVSLISIGGITLWMMDY